MSEESTTTVCKGSTPADIRLAAMNLLARREHSLGELRCKLGARFHDSEAVEDQLLRLASEGLQSDERFAESFVRQRVSRGQGPLRIDRDLRQRFVASATICSALAEAHVDWGDLAAAVLQKRFGPDPAADARELARRARFLQYRGFSGEHYRHLVNRG